MVAGDRGVAVRPSVIMRVSHDKFRQIPTRQSGGRPVGHELTFPEDDHPLRDPEDLLESVRHIHKTDACARKSSD